MFLYYLGILEQNELPVEMLTRIVVLINIYKSTKAFKVAFEPLNSFNSYC